MLTKTLSLSAKTNMNWVDCVLSNFDEFLKDHADCERKASNMAMSFVAKYPDRREIIPELIRTGIEELEHFRLVYKIMEERDLQLNHSIGEDKYVKELLRLCHSDREKRFRDRLIIASIIENRGFERFKLISENLNDPKMAKFYRMIYESEAKHGDVFVEMATEYFPEEEVYERWDQLADEEGQMLERQPLKPTLH